MQDDFALNRIAEVIQAMTQPVARQSLPAVDLADMRAVFTEAGPALHGTGTAFGKPGDGRAARAAQLALADLNLQLGKDR
ncbi:MAG: hypothetical protein QM682_04685 [Paracoccus sp. (in: a-proteobacteria)]|uniref:hypothetical protein n=1 Tax=Paracoccus sp. TaxID=267 RepID=UPI0039E66C66